MRKKFPTFPTSKIRNRTAKSVLVLAAAVYLIFLAVRDDKAHKEYQQVFSQAQEHFATYFIDVGQGDATLLVAPDGSSMLIDCGPTSGAEYLVKYMNDVGVEKLDYLILTHPHEDHYGGASAVIENFPVENFVVHADFTETYPYDRLIYMVSHNRFDEQTEIVGTRIDDRFTFADSAVFQILSPETVDYDDANESSLAIKLIYGETSFLFTGDAEKGAEKAMMANGYDLRADVYSAGHHGSVTSNSPGFIAAVSPTYAVISCGRDNSYGHPHKKTLATLEEYGVTVLRTDELGDIILLSDGENVWPLEQTSAGQTEMIRAA